MINASYFASAWFITIFTNSMKKQHRPDFDEESKEPLPGVSENLLQLWDYFLVSGWKAVLKMGLFVLKEDSGNLVQLSFEEILSEIAEKPKTLLCTHGVRIRPIKAEMDDTPTTLYLTLKKTFLQSDGIQSVKV
jgi:hypothetical protein